MGCGYLTNGYFDYADQLDGWDDVGDYPVEWYDSLGTNVSGMVRSIPFSAAGTRTHIIETTFEIVDHANLTNVQAGEGAFLTATWYWRTPVSGYCGVRTYLFNPNGEEIYYDSTNISTGNSTGSALLFSAKNIFASCRRSKIINGTYKLQFKLTVQITASGTAWVGLDDIELHVCHEKFTKEYVEEIGFSDEYTPQVQLAETDIVGLLESLTRKGGPDMPVIIEKMALLEILSAWVGYIIKESVLVTEVLTRTYGFANHDLFDSVAVSESYSAIVKKGNVTRVVDFSAGTQWTDRVPEQTDWNVS